MRYIFGQLILGQSWICCSSRNGQRIRVECKRVDAPRLTPSMRTAHKDLELAQLLVIYPEPHPYPLDKNIQAIPLASLAERPVNLY